MHRATSNNCGYIEKKTVIIVHNVLMYFFNIWLEKGIYYIFFLQLDSLRFVFEYGVIKKEILWWWVRNS